MRYLQICFAVLGVGVLLYVLKSMAGINLIPHYHAIDILLQPMRVWEDLRAA
jgi:hypothetical protein